MVRRSAATAISQSWGAASAALSFDCARLVRGRPRLSADRAFVGALAPPDGREIAVARVSRRSSPMQPPFAWPRGGRRQTTCRHVRYRSRVDRLERPSGPVLFCGSPTGGQSLVGHRAEIAQLVEHATENRGVASSILALGTTIGVVATSSGSGSVGRASPCQGEGRGFESRLPLHFPVRRTIGRPAVPLPLRLVVGQRTLDPFTEVRILEGQPN